MRPLAMHRVFQRCLRRSCKHWHQNLLLIASPQDMPIRQSQMVHSHSFQNRVEPQATGYLPKSTNCILKRAGSLVVNNAAACPPCSFWPPQEKKSACRACGKSDLLYGKEKQLRDSVTGGLNFQSAAGQGGSRNRCRLTGTVKQNSILLFCVQPARFECVRAAALV
jgi:hypothetical protein